MERYYLKDYLRVLIENRLLIESNDLSEFLENKIYGVSCNSNDVIKDSIFICKGNSFKSDYLKDAVKRGAIFYLSEKIYDVNIPCILVNDVRRAMAVVTNLFYENSKETLNIIGITGTKGKSTTAYYVKYILDEYAKEKLENDTGIISSITTYDGKNNDYSL